MSDTKTLTDDAARIWAENYCGKTTNTTHRTERHNEDKGKQVDHKNPRSRLAFYAFTPFLGFARGLVYFNRFCSYLDFHCLQRVFWMDNWHQRCAAIENNSYGKR